MSDNLYHGLLRFVNIYVSGSLPRHRTRDSQGYEINFAASARMGHSVWTETGAINSGRSASILYEAIVAGQLLASGEQQSLRLQGPRRAGGRLTRRPHVARQ